MTFRSLYRLERRGLLNCPIVGVAGGRVERRATCAGTPRTAIAATGEALDDEVFARLAARHVATCRATSPTPRRTQRVAAAIGGAGQAGLLPGDPAVAVRHGGRRACATAGADATGAGRDREAVRARPGLGRGLWPTSCTSTSRSRSSTASTTSWGRWAWGEILFLRFANTMLEPVWNRNYVEPRADHDGRAVRGRGPRSLLRPGRRAARRGRQPPDAGRRRGSHGPAGLRRRRRAARRADGDVPGHQRRRPGPLRAGPVRRVPGQRRASPPDSTPRRTSRCASRSTTGGGRACRSSSARASTCRSPRPSCGSCSSARRAWASRSSPPRSEPPGGPPRPVGRHPLRDGGQAGGRGRAGRHHARHGVRRPGWRRTDAVRGAAARRARRRRQPLPRQVGIEEAWRVVQPLLDTPPAAEPYAQGSWGPASADRLLAGLGHWAAPWTGS